MSLLACSIPETERENVYGPSHIYMYLVMNIQLAGGSRATPTRMD